ncbi:glucose-6-phosphate dehydrogenase [Acetobacter orleanensis]|uniref:Glucose-6-phosphate 1-dehydrogenase n=1 Tax=Acetobacter orleanensis TaxID=104099 RepID=A0A4Y3TN88_9PROT|nr:glucose-6-phosphate dehydrogenase [Acetobacter orleanensis]KXV62402.1 glucose-6-phosphate dehydrogenase [Acetobacter orleanensis]PCD79377.1 glucose-6-phosphate dehydrogenase [Acetobacter orleanensis]GAN67643.1 glucose-6-phosphate 1-dehydrogenase [Acetobacter orleanensis JCM 7639]GEB82497.1 glucose-6-phosphate 1-dehydrogenase [Acetobacter orleanensis]
MSSSPHSSRTTASLVAPAAIHPAPAGTLVILGAAGDLAHRLLVPALYDLACNGFLPDDFRILGISLEKQSTKSWIASLRAKMESFTQDKHAEFYTISLNEEAWSWLTSRMSYHALDFTSVEALRTLAPEIGERNAVFYLATQPRFFGPAAQSLAKAGLMEEAPDRFRRLVVEKPFGTDLHSAQTLNAHLLSFLKETQIYRVDHFLGKETVQNLLALRFSNLLFDPLWRRDYIDHIQITAAETLSVEGRGVFYDATGALRDMVPNHLFQLLALVAMEPPSSLKAEAIRNAKQQVFDAIRPISPENAVRGQYAAGNVAGRKIAAYRDSPGVSPDSTTETYAALKIEIDTWRWAGVPFYLRTGKALNSNVTEIVVQFKQTPHPLFHTADGTQQTPNRFVYNIRPEKGADLHFNAKHPGPETVVEEVVAAFRYQSAFGAIPNVGYETLLYDCLQGNATLFQRADNIEAGWRAVNPVLEAWNKAGSPPEFYEAGSTGPAGADALLARDGRCWAPFGQLKKDR